MYKVWKNQLITKVFLTEYGKTCCEACVKVLSFK